MNVSISTATAILARGTLAALMDITGENQTNRHITLGCFLYALTRGVKEPETVAGLLSVTAAQISHSQGPFVALADIQQERLRQKLKGWTPDHDDEHEADGRLALAGAVYALQSVLAGVPADAPTSKAENEAFDAVDLLRPLSPCNHDKALSQREHLVRAAACIVAEIERIDRATHTKSAALNLINHPLPVSTRIISVLGEHDSGDDGPRETGPNAEGMIISRYQLASQGWTYDVVFPLSGVWVVLIESDPLNDPTKYQILQAEPDWQPIATAPREWVGDPVTVPLDGRPITFRHGKEIRVRGAIDGGEATAIVYIAQQSGFPAGEEPHWWDLSAEMPLGWAPAEWRELTADERSKLDSTDREG